ncbi:tetratricopeptide repeat protein [Flavobacterium sp.]
MKFFFTFYTLFILSTINVHAQSATGQTILGIDACCFNGFTWTINYAFIFNGNNAKGIELEIYNRTISVTNNKYQTGGKQYSLSDLGMSQWPVEPEEAMLSGTVTIYYNGTPIKTYNEAVITSKNLGTFDQWKEGGKEGPYAAIGSLKIKLDDFNVNNFSVKFTNVSAAGVNPNGSDQIYKAVQAKIQGIANNSNNKQSSSNNASSQSGTPTNNSSSNNTSNNYELKYSDVGIPQSTAPSKSDFQKNYETGQQLGQITNTIVDIFTPSPEEIARREKATAEYARQKKIEEDIDWKKRKIEGKDRFDQLYLPLMDTAIKGDENARMILYFASYRLFSTSKVPNRDVWFKEAFKNNNPDALMEVAEGKKKDADWIYYLQNAANVGSVDAMLRLADWYNRKKKVAIIDWSYGGGGDAKLAFELYTKAAQKGSPNAMYYLGMIYKYGQTSNEERYITKTYLKYELVIDEKKALEWFEKSIQPNYPISLFATNSKTITESYLDLSSYFNKEAYKELSLIYAKGKIVPKDKVKAKELLNLYESYGSHYDKYKF